MVLRELEVAKVVEHPKQVVLVTTSDSLARDVRDLVMHRLDAIDGEDDPDIVANAIRTVAADHLLVCLDRREPFKSSPITAWSSPRAA